MTVINNTTGGGVDKSPLENALFSHLCEHYDVGRLPSEEDLDRMSEEDFIREKTKGVKDAS